MAEVGKSTLSQQLEQGAALSPVQIQTIKLLPLSSIELEEAIAHELEENPALEECYDSGMREEENKTSAEDWDLGDYATEDDIPAYRLKELQDRNLKQEEIPFSANAPSLMELLIAQMDMLDLTERQYQIASYLAGEINEDGYLLRSNQELSDDLILRLGLDVGIDEIEAAVRLIQSLDPAGVGARNLRECLLLQLERMEHKDDLCLLSIRVIGEYYELFTGKKYEQLAEKLAISPSDLQEVYHFIEKLNPRPAGGFTDIAFDRMNQFTPDFIVSEDEEGALSLTVVGEREIRPLIISPDYQKILSQDESALDKEALSAHTFLKHKVNQARWFIEALQQRQHTLRATMEAIMRHQWAFFISGDISALRPLVLRQVAEETSLDISTISRVTNSKSVETPYGIYPLKFFFGEGQVTEDGREVSSKVIKNRLQELVDTEDKAAPLNDTKLQELLQKEGYTLSRRTVAKYRDELNIPTATLRRSI